MAAPTLPKPPSLGGQGDDQKQAMLQQMAMGVMGNQMMAQMFPAPANPYMMGNQPPTPNVSGIGAGQPAAAPVAATSSLDSTPSYSGTSSVPDTSSHAAFIKSMYPVAQQWSAKTGIPPEILLAMNISESNWGNAPGNELFGIKAPGDAGSINSPTWESVNGQRVNTSSDFGAYSSPDAAYAAFWNLVSTSPRYAGAMAALQAGDTNGFLQGLVRGGYATDQNWGNAIQNIANTTVNPMLGA